VALPRHLTGRALLPNVAHKMRPSFRLHHCTAIITGASSGLGAEFARQLAPHADGLVLTARRADALERVKDEVQSLNPDLKVILCACDIASDAGRAQLLEVTTALEPFPNLLINNAGAGDYGTFATSDEARTRGQIDLNITALVMLTHALLPRLQRGAGTPAGVLNVSSLAAMLPMPGLAVYAATKSFVTSFSEALRVELSDANVVVTAVCPGPTPTNFGRNARRPDGTDTDRSGQGLIRVRPQTVVRQALDALSQGRACVHPGVSVTLASVLFRLMPRRMMRLLIEKRFRAGSRERAPI